MPNLKDLVRPTAADFESLKEARKRIAETLPIVDEAQRCGTECEGFRAILQAMDQQLAEIEAVLFTPPPQPVG